jgi:hypothetical protein
VIDVLERGDVLFMYRPTVQPADALVEVPGVQSFFLVLGPAGGGPHRRVRVGRKRMPPPRARFWARVERVGPLREVLADQLEDERYTTRTRGERYQPGARLIAEGCYAIVRHDDHCHLAYRVERAAPADEVPDEVRVPEAASHVLLFEREDGGRPPWTTAGRPELLDARGFELVLVGAGDDPEGALGIELVPSD